MATWEEEENEICNDDGFIYKRRKRQEEVVSTLLKAPAAPAVVVDLEAGLKQRKKRTIAKLKDRYKKEIFQWELLSNTLRELEQRTQQHQQTQQQQQQQQASSFRDETTESSSHNQLIEPRLQSHLDQHLSQAEAQAALIQNMTMLCNEAEAMCKAEEERVKKNFFNLPIWENPKTLFACLSDDVECNNENAVET